MPLSNQLPGPLEDLIGPCVEALHRRQKAVHDLKESMTYQEALTRDVRAVLSTVYQQGYVVAKDSDSITFLFRRIRDELPATEPAEVELEVDEVFTRILNGMDPVT